MKTDPESNIDLTDLEDISIDRIPAVLTQLAAASQHLAARLLSTNGQAQTATTNGRLLDVTEASERLGCSSDWLYRHASDMPFVVRVGRLLRFSESGLEKWIRTRSGR